MPNLRRTPWVAIDVDIRKDDRLVDLPSDSARYGYIAAVLAEARLQDPRAVFPSRAVLAEAIGRFDRFVPKYLEVGLLHQVPHQCQPCRQQYGTDVRRGAIVVHNWHSKQHDPTHAERQRRYREGQPSDAERDGESDAQRDGKRDAKVTATSRARAVTQTQTPNTEEDQVVPRVTPRGRPSAGSSFFDIEPADPRHPVAEILATRYRYRTVTEAQWDRLHEIVDNEFPIGTTKGRDRHLAWRWLADVMRGLRRDDGDPIAAAIGEVNRRIRERLGAAEQAVAS